MRRKLLHTTGFLVAIHLLCLLALGGCRIMLLFYNAPAGGIDWALAGRAMVIGLKFDNLIACYVTALPLLLLTIGTLCTAHRAAYARQTRKALRVIGWYYGIVYALGLIIEVANVRYFRFFDNHLNISVVEWFGFVRDTAGMLFGDAANLVAIVVSLILVGLFEWALVAIVRSACRRIDTVASSVSWQQYAGGVGFSLLLYGACFCGIRGSFQRYPLDVSFAYFCDNAFYNKLGVNPIFNIIKSTEYTAQPLPPLLAEANEAEALAAVQQELGVQNADPQHPLMHTIPGTDGLGKRNVVVILMESMSAAHLDEMYNGQHITPYLSALRNRSLYFNNFYSAGVHTNNGITATLYGYGPNFAKATMRVPSDIYTGLPHALRQNGYNTFAFVTGNPQYDNMNSFFYDNNIERVYSLYDYPSSAAVNNFGVPDDYMFSFGLQQLAQRTDTTEKPFFALFLTVSNHTPFVIPEAYQENGGTDTQRIVAYADDALRAFMEQAQQTVWGRNTVFVLVGDHGGPASSAYDYNLPLNQIPCFFVGNGIADTTLTAPAQQQDIAPTLLGLLGLPYTENTMGINQLQHSRDYTYFVNNDHLGCTDGEWLYSYSINTQQEYLYRIGEDAKDYSASEPQRMEHIRRYAVQHQLINLLSVQNQWINPCE